MRAVLLAVVSLLIYWIWLAFQTVLGLGPAGTLVRPVQNPDEFDRFFAAGRLLIFLDTCVVWPVILLVAGLLLSRWNARPLRWSEVFVLTVPPTIWFALFSLPRAAFALVIYSALVMAVTKYWTAVMSRARQ